MWLSSKSHYLGTNAACLPSKPLLSEEEIKVEEDLKAPPPGDSII